MQTRRTKFQEFEEFLFDDGFGHHNLFYCWKSVQSVTSMSWIDFCDDFIGECDKVLTINMEEFIHFSTYPPHSLNSARNPFDSSLPLHMPFGSAEIKSTIMNRSLDRSFHRDSFRARLP
jgi:hypothetical protein